jgi:Domain of unknown function (DUF4440)
MARTHGLLLALVIAVSSVAVGQEAGKTNSDLEKMLWDADQQWLCSGPYQKPHKDCVQFRSQYWADQFFEIYPSGQVQTKAEMVASQSAQNPAPGTGPYPQDFKLMAVYGNIALATDLTRFKTVDAHGNLAFTSQARVLRIFVKEKGKWRPASAALVGMPMQ